MARARARARRFSRLPNFAGGNAKVSKLSFNVGACEGRVEKIMKHAVFLVDRQTMADIC